MKEFFENCKTIWVWIFNDLMPIISEMKKATYGPLGNLIELVTKIVAIGAIIIGALKFWDKYIRK